MCLYRNAVCTLEEFDERFNKSASQASSCSSKGADRLEQTLATRERKTLLTIIVALSQSQNIDWTRPHKAAQQIAPMVELLGAEIAPRTIQDHLSRIPQFVERRTKH